jgi:predicted CopG family antitoxin
MAVKTITIDMEAYETLSRLKREGLSFSDVIKGNFRSHRASDLLLAVNSITWSNATADAIARQVKVRAKQRARAAKL